jgi:hypothetical protein
MSRKYDISKAAALMGRKGGKAAAQSATGKHLRALTPEQASQRARDAARARWGESCECGECGKCKRREAMRRYRAGRGSQAGA